MTMKKVFYSFSLCCLLLAGRLAAQDAVFSNPTLSPANLSPALTGVSDYQSRLQLIYRNQYAFLGEESFNTISAAYDRRFASGKRDYFGAGASVLADRAGALDFSTLHLKLSGSFIKQMGVRKSRLSWLSAGLDVGYVQKKVKLSAARWGSQHDGKGDFDPNLFSGADYLDQPSNAGMDLGAGLMYFSRDEKNGRGFYLGGAFHHLMRRDESFSSTTNSPVSRRTALHAGGEFPVDGAPKRFRLLPQAAFQKQAGASQLLGSVDLRYVLVRGKQDNIQFQLGGGWRGVNKAEQRGLASDALIFRLRMDYNNLSVGASYDFTISGLRTVGAGALEVGALYHFEGREDRKPACPF